MSIDSNTRRPGAEGGLNIGELIRNGEVLATREVVALIHEVCRQPRACPRGPEDLWLTDSGEVRVAVCERPTQPVEARDVAASLLEAMLPAEGSDQLERQVSSALRGLPARLRSSNRRAGAQDRNDLMSILAWHLAGDPRKVLQVLVHRVGRRQSAVASPPHEGANDLDLFPAATSSSAAPRAALHQAAPPGKTSLTSARALVAAIILLAGAASVSYWWFRDAEWRRADPAAAAATDTGATDVGPLSAPPVSEPPAPRIVFSPPTATEPVKISSPGGAFSPAFASGGRELFFHAGRTDAGRLLVANLDDRGTVASVDTVIDERARNYHARVSPDGRQIAFDSDRDGERGVYISARDGSEPRRVSGGGYAAVPTWSPDGKWLAFIRAETDRPRVWNLWLRNLATGALQRHTAFRSGQVWGASWFPDGRSFCFSHDQQLIISHLDGRDDVVIESPRRGRLVRTPAVSPDGARVVFQVFKDGVWLLDIATRAMRRIEHDPTAEEFAWAPNGRRIAYHSRRDGAWKIWVTPVDAGAN